MAVPHTSDVFGSHAGIASSLYGIRVSVFPPNAALFLESIFSAACALLVSSTIYFHLFHLQGEVS